MCPDAPEIQAYDIHMCFEDCSENTVQSVTIYAKQPVAGTNDTYHYDSDQEDASSGNLASKINVGHTFITLQQEINGNTNTIVFGFYPDPTVGVFDGEKPGVFKYDDGEPYSVSVTYDLDCIGWNNLLANVTNIMLGDPLYNLNDFNCTDFGISLVNSIGLNVPDTNGSWPLGGGSNPGYLGQDLRNLPLGPNMSRDADGGHAPASICN